MVRNLLVGNIPDSAPGWLSELFDTPDLKAVATEGAIEEPGEFD